MACSQRLEPERLIVGCVRGGRTSPEASGLVELERKLCRYLLMQQAHWSFAQSSLWGRLAAHHLRGQSCRTTTGGRCGKADPLYANLYGASSVVALG